MRSRIRPLHFYLGFICAFVLAIAALLVSDPDKIISTPKSAKVPPASIPFRVRANANLNFAAVEAAIAFPVPLTSQTGGIVFFDRLRQTAKLIVVPEVYLASPHFSADGQRMLMVAGPNDRDLRRLLSCKVSNWECDVVLQTNNTIFSPIYIDNGEVLLSSSPLINEGTTRARYSRHNFYLLDIRGHLHQLSDIGFYQLSSFSVSASNLMFTAVGASKRNILDDSRLRAGRGGSDIYLAKFLSASRQLLLNSIPLKPQFDVEGFSSFPIISEEGDMVAFINRRTTGAENKYNLVIATSTGNILKYIEADGSFSRPQITKAEILANVLSQNSYRVHAVARDSLDSKIVFELKFDSDQVKNLEVVNPQLLSR